MCREVADTGRHRYHHQVVLRDMVVPLVEHKAALARRTQQVHASVAQFLGIHAVEVAGILKIYLHGDKITHYLLYKRTVDAKCESLDAFCATIVSEIHRTFAPSKQTTRDYGVYQIIKRSGDAVAGLRRVSGKS